MANYGQLAMRDPALAALLGALPGSDFGAEFGGSEYDMNGQAGVIPDRGADMGAEFGAEFGYYGYGADAPAAMVHAPHAMAHRGHAPIHPEHAALLRAHHHRQHQTEVRERLLEPNKGSTTKVERYDFSLNQTLTIGTPVVVDMSLQPSVTLRPQRLICNAPAPGFVSFLTIQVANVAVTVGNATDAYSYSAVAVGSHLDCPTLSPANRVILVGEYSGLCPNGKGWKGALVIQDQLERWWTATMPPEKIAVGPAPRKGRRQKMATVPARFPFDLAQLLNTEAPGPYPEGSNFLFIATFQGPVAIVS